MADSYQRPETGEGKDDTTRDIKRINYLAAAELIRSAGRNANPEVGDMPETESGNIRRVIRETVRKHIRIC